MNEVESRLKDAFYSRIKERLIIPELERKLLNYIMKYRDRNIRILSSPYITINMFFSPDDYQIVYDTVGITEKELKIVMKDIKPPGNMTEAKANFTPFNALMVMILGYYSLNNSEEKYETIYSYYAYSTYWSLFKKYYDFNPRLETMKAVVNNMSNKFKLKQTASLDLSLRDTVKTAVTTYQDKLERLNDYDIMEVIDAIKTRLNNYMKNIRNEYKKAYDKGEVIYSDNEFGEDDTIVERSGITNQIDVLANEYTSKFFSMSLNLKLIETSAKLCGVSSTELRTAVNLLLQEDKIEEVRSFYMAIFYLFLNGGNDVKDIKSIKFLYIMDGIYKKGNSNDKNIRTVKSIMNKWLEDGSASYRTSTRPDTLNRYRKAIFWFFVQIVSNS